MKYIPINFRSHSLSCAHLRLQVVNPCIPATEEPATGELMVETLDYRALVSRKFYCPYLECT